MRAARRAVFPSVKWQRCQFHMAQNAQSYAPKEVNEKRDWRALRRIFQSRDYAQLKKKSESALRNIKRVRS